MQNIFRNKNSFRLFFLSFSLLLSISSSHAQTQDKPQNTASILTQGELEQCLQRTNELTQRSIQLKEQSTQLQTLTDKVEKLELKREDIAVDFHSQQSVDGYNLLNNEIEELRQQYNDNAQDFNQQVKQYKMDTERLKSECDNKKYYQ
jgi:outer membrane murein-binding lipoprotein Lpp